LTHCGRTISIWQSDRGGKPVAIDGFLDGRGSGREELRDIVSDVSPGRVPKLRYMLPLTQADKAAWLPNR
jgi:hypothetical protein